LVATSDKKLANKERRQFSRSKPKNGEKKLKYTRSTSEWKVPKILKQGEV
jgi:hypothetical protein